LQSLGGHDGDEHNTHQNDITIITKTMIILILMVFSYSHSDSKIKLIMLETQLNQKSIVIHNVMTKIHYYKHEFLTKKSFSRKAHESLKSLLIT
jgi:hypothetical protein